MKSQKIIVHKERAEPWNVTLVDTGDHSMTGGRLKRIESYLKSEKAFCLTPHVENFFRSVLQF
jgi:glucose-1-phosphate cytidylyltransferase